jgi:hypothetical protein
MDARTAERMFEENLRLFTPRPETEPEKFNLYGGLANLAKELQGIRSELARLGQAVGQLQRR